MATNLALQLQVIEPETDLNSIIIGNTNYNDDVWDLKPFIHNKSVCDCRTKIDFRYIKIDKIRDIAKKYAYYRLGKVKPLTVNEEINNRFVSIYEFLSINGITELSEITHDIFLEFNFWLKQEKHVKEGTGYLCSHLFEDIIRIGQIKGWDVPQFHLAKTETANQIWNASNSIKKNKTKPIPEDVFNQILYHAIHKEQDIFTKAGIIIQSQTGLRINEVLSIQEGCLNKTADDYVYMVVTLGKTEKGEPIHHKVFVNELVAEVIEELSKHTEQSRKKSGIKFLFIQRNEQRMTRDGFDRKLKRFVSRWNIRDAKGNIYSLSSHQFRATFVRELVKRKVPIAMIMKQYSHVSIEMTAHYLTLQEEEIKEIYTDMILSPESKIAGLRAKEIKGKLDDLFHGKTETEIDDVISDLAKTMSFNPLPTGVCLYDFRRGNCTDGDGCFMYNCPNYITEIQFYPILKSELELLEKEMTRLKKLGREREWQRQYIKYKYLKPLVDDLEVQLNDKESVG